MNGHFTRKLRMQIDDAMNESRHPLRVTMVENVDAHNFTSAETEEKDRWASVRLQEACRFQNNCP